jgi:hypothetical protein
MGWLPSKNPAQKPGNVYQGLRRNVLGLDPATIGLAPTPEHPMVFAGLMEMGMEGGVASLVVIGDGTTSLYYSTGGGIIGAGLHESVKAPSRFFLSSLERHVKELAPDEPGHPTPAAGMTHLRALIFGGGHLLVAARGEEFGEKRHPLWEIFYAGHGVITAMRKLPQAPKHA